MQFVKSSLIEFSIGNFKIFRDKVSFSAVGRKSDKTFLNNGESLYRTSLIYGPNASGKSTLFESFEIMVKFILDSANKKIGTKLPYKKFKFSDRKDVPTFFEMIFTLGKSIYKYNFSFFQNNIETENLSEILSSGSEKKYLTRKRQKIELYYDLLESEDIKKKTREEVLFLSAASQWNDKLCKFIVENLDKNFNVIQGPRNDEYSDFTRKVFKKDLRTRGKILDLLKRADFCIFGGESKEVEVPEKIRERMINFVDSNKIKIPETIDRISFFHKKFNNQNKEIGMEPLDIVLESIGTQKFFDILGPIVDTLETGKVLMIDEFDNSLHPLLTKFILDIFEKNNDKNAQLFVTTHDTSLISRKNDFDRAQIWFTEKDIYGVGSLYSLEEFKDDLRNDTEFSKKYLEGRFGALPFIDIDEENF